MAHWRVDFHAALEGVWLVVFVSIVGVDADVLRPVASDRFPPSLVGPRDILELGFGEQDPADDVIHLGVFPESGLPAFEPAHDLLVCEIWECLAVAVVLVAEVVGDERGAVRNLLD